MKDHIPTDPLPDGWYWDNSYCTRIMRVARIKERGRYSGEDWVPAWASKHIDVWEVYSEGEREDGTKGLVREATFPTAEEATHYISARALLGTWPKKPE